ncbi:unnamed protein product, partial [Prorocentrum cordatum]
AALQMLCISTQRTRDTRPARGSGDGLREAANESNQEYSNRMSKWAGDVWQLVKDEAPEDFFYIMELSQLARQPLDHFFFFLEKKIPAGEPRALAQLVWGKAEQISTELHRLTCPEPWLDFLETLPLNMVRDYSAIIEEVTMEALSDFERR